MSLNKPVGKIVPLKSPANLEPILDLIKSKNTSFKDIIEAGWSKQSIDYLENSGLITRQQITIYKVVDQ